MAINSSFSSDFEHAQIKGWLSARLGDMCDVRDGTHESPQFFDTGVPLVTSKNIKNGFVDLSDIKFISNKDANEINKRSAVSKNDILMSMIGSIGDVALITKAPKFCIKNVALIKQGRLNQNYLRHWLQGPIFQSSLRETLDGGIQKFISLGKLRDFEIYFPTTEKEQQAIAEALSDADDYIRGLEELIDKKRDVKQGAMQELLTSCRRIAGLAKSNKMKMTEIGEIPEDWTFAPLENLADIRSGGTPSTKDETLWGGDVPWITPTDITRLNGNKRITKTERTISGKGLKQSSAELIPAGSIILTTRATIGEAAINSEPMATNQGFKNLVPSQQVDNEFLYYLLLTKKPDMIALCGGSTFLEISKSQLAAILVQFPLEKSEQKAIAEVLSNMDDELTALGAQLDKAKLIKQAMMQELLTGRIRLV